MLANEVTNLSQLEAFPSELSYFRTFHDSGGASICSKFETGTDSSQSLYSFIACKEHLGAINEFVHSYDIVRGIKAGYYVLVQ